MQRDKLQNDKASPLLAPTQNISHRGIQEKPTSESTQDPGFSQVRRLTGGETMQLSDTGSEVPSPTQEAQLRLVMEKAAVVSDPNTTDRYCNLVCEDSVDLSNEELVREKIEVDGSVMDSPDVQGGECQETVDNSSFTQGSTDPQNPSDDGQSGSMASPQRQAKKTFKQQNVKDFINFFPVDDSGSIDAKSFVIGSCSMQRKIEYVPPVRRSGTSKASEPSPQMPADHGDKAGKEGVDHVGVKEDCERDTALKNDLVGSQNAISKHATSTEKQPAISSVRTTVPPTSAPIQQPALSSALPTGTSIGGLPVPLVLDSTLTQPVTMVGLPLQQTQQDAQMSSLIQQQQLINAVSANIQAFNAVDAAGQPGNTVEQKLPDPKELSNLQGIVGLQNLQGIGSGQVIPGIQGIVGTSNFQGLQGVTDPRLVSLTGLQSIGVLPNMTGLQGLLGGLHGFPGLQGVAGLQGVGCQGITGPVSPTGLAGLQGIQNLQAVSGFQGLQAVPSLQGLVAFPGLSALSGVQGLQGLGIVGPPAVQGLQAVAALQGNTYLQSITGVPGTSGLISGIPTCTQPGVFQQLGIATPTGATCQRSVAYQAQQIATSQAPKEQVTTAPTKVERSTTTCSLPEQTSQAANKDSMTQDTSSFAEPRIKPSDATQEKLKGRSRRKQASPRCISKQHMMSIDSTEDTEEEDYDRYVVLKDNPAEYSTPVASMEFESGADTGSTSHAESGPSSKPGTKLFKKVEELISATKPQLDIDCSSADPADDDSPSPQTWRRFLERERQRNDRLKEVEERLARLQAMSFNVQAAGPQLTGPAKSFASVSTQTDCATLPGNDCSFNDRIAEQREQLERVLHDAEEVIIPAAGGGGTHGQIQQGVVTSSGDSPVRKMSSDVARIEEEMTGAPVLPADDLAHPQNELPLPPPPSTVEGAESPAPAHTVETRIMNKPSTIWLPSSKRKRKVSRTCVNVSASPHLADLSDLDQNRSLIDEEGNQEALMEDAAQLVAPAQKKKGYVYQIPLDGIESKAGQDLGTLNLDTEDHNLDNLMSLPERVGEIMTSISPVDTSQNTMENQVAPVLPWEVQGLSKIERNRIRAREGMRRHREKLRQAKLASQTWILSAIAQDSLGHAEATPPFGESNVSDESTCLSTTLPTDLSTTTILNQTEGLEKSNCDIQSDLESSRVESPHNHNNSPLLGRDFYQKPFGLLSQVAGNIKPEMEDNSLTLGRTASSDSPINVNDSIQVPLHGEHLTNLMEKYRIDFTQEPYRSMSLEERNRIRAREGMRRYRERKKQARLQLSKMSSVKPHGPRGHHKQDAIRATSDGSSTSNNKVAAAEHLVELAKWHTKSAPGLTTFSERLQFEKLEELKRRRTFSLIKFSGKRPRPLKTSRLNDNPVLKTFKTDSDEHGDMSSSSSSAGAGSWKVGNHTVIKRELFEESDSKQTKGSPKKAKHSSRKGQSAESEASVDSVRLTSISGEVDESSENSMCEKKRHSQSDLTLRKQHFREKVACGMDRYAAVSVTEAAERTATHQSLTQNLQEDANSIDDHEMAEKEIGTDEMHVQDHLS